MERIDLYPMANTVRDYAWGSSDFIQRLLGREPDGRPAAELWMGAHPAAPSDLVGRDATLGDLVARRPVEVLGRRVVDRFGPRLPFLLKVLAAERPLSIQAHPTIAQAQAGYADEDARGIPLDAPERNYVDRNHKPELICALTDFDALCGFRPVAESARLVDELTVAGASALSGYAARIVGEGGLRDVVTTLLTMPADRQRAVVASVRPAAQAVAAGRGRFAADCGWTERIAAIYPHDIGVVLALLMNLVTLRPGQALFLGAGQIHAYLRGAGVELMASSDNVLRCGLTGKHVDPPELLRVLDFSDGPVRPLQPEVAGGVREYPSPVPDFALTEVTVNEDTRVLARAAGPQIVLCTSGVVELSVDAGFAGPAVSLAGGESVFVPAGVSLAARGTGQLFRATTHLTD